MEFVWCDAILWIRACAVVTSDSIDTPVLTSTVAVLTLIHICGKKVIIFLLRDGATQEFSVLINFDCRLNLHEAIGVVDL